MQASVHSIVIADKSTLSKETARASADKFLRHCKHSQCQGVHILTISGFGEDDRDLWEIREVNLFCSHFLHFAGFTTRQQLKEFTGTVKNDWLFVCRAASEGRILNIKKEGEFLYFKIQGEG